MVSEASRGLRLKARLLAAALVLGGHGRASAQEAHVALVSHPRGLTFYRIETGPPAARGESAPTGTAFVPLCTDPCNVTLPAGRRELAIGRGDQTPKKTDSVMLRPGSWQVSVSLEDNSAARRLGFGIMLAGGVAGALLTFVGLHTGATVEKDSAVVGLGVGILSLSLVAGTVIVLNNPDKVDLVRTGVPAVKASAMGPPGLALKGFF
jgi:hypothetical protein